MKAKKWVAILMAAALALGLVGTATAASTVPGAVYTDELVPGSAKTRDQVALELYQAGVRDVTPDFWAAASLTVMLQAGLMAPDGAGNLHPNAPVSAGDGIAAFAKVLGIASKLDTPAVAAEKMKQAGLIPADTTIDRPMTRMEVARLIATALGVKPKFVTQATYPFNDWSAVSAEDAGILAALYDLGVVKGYPDRTFKPGQTLTRAELATLIDRVLGVK